MADAQDLFQFLNDVWDLLPADDRLRFGETWRAYEQTYGDVWMKLFERDLGINIDTVPLYNNQRWLKHEFNEDTAVMRAATFRSTQDVSEPLDLSTRYLIKFAIDDGTPVEVNLQGAVPTATTNLELVTKINAAAGFAFSELVSAGSLLDFRSGTLGPTSSIEFLAASVPSADASALILGLDPDTDLPKTVPEFPFEYQLGDRMLVGIPRLQTHIHPEHEDNQTLVEETDYTVEFGTGVISFKLEPPAAMWGPDNLVNLETPYNNFGYLLDIYNRNTPGYLKAVRGLWFAFWTGPRPENIRRSLYLLFGLPTASAAGTVTGLTPSTITLTYADDSQEAFAIPSGLTALVGLGQSVTRFQPLVSGIVVLDKINSPGFVEREVGREGIRPFLTERASLGTDPDTDESRALKTIEENSYLPQIDVNSFISTDINLGNVRTFLRNMQPKSRTFFFQVLVGVFREEVVLEEHMGMDITLDVTPNLDSNPNVDGEDAEREAAEIEDDTSLILDSEGMILGDHAYIEVRHGVTLVDSFRVEG